MVGDESRTVKHPTNWPDPRLTGLMPVLPAGNTRPGGIFQFSEALEWNAVELDHAQNTGA